ncbi:hypothetical protein [Marinifilum sp. D737]|uniref:hypothetical protein n=1 Tax=Marinifilum sp. D737 TaxID=2969628 RepID=UPI0022762384|nr:hypothetical protein [Marinifilum sp. D737]MCY1634965.1 hypothetical protein [Marinifilum sp. D737]
MKNLLFLILFVFFLTPSCDEKESSNVIPCTFVDYWYYNDEPYSLGKMSGDYILLGVESVNTIELIEEFITSKTYFDQGFEYKVHEDSHYSYIALKLYKTCTCEEIAWILEDAKENSIVSSAHYTIESADCDNLIFEKSGEECVYAYSNFFHIRVKDPSDLSDLNHTLSETNTWIKEQNDFMDNWFSIYTDKDSRGDALQMANYFYETGLFDASEPDIFQIVIE